MGQIKNIKLHIVTDIKIKSHIDTRPSSQTSTMPKADKLKKSKKAEKTIHPNSRKATQLHRANHKTELKQKRKDERSEKDKHLWEKVCWFRDQLAEGKDKYSMIEVCQLISKYINRFQERMKEIEDANTLNKQLGRHGQSSVAEQSAITMVYEKEHGSFESGHFEAPDLTNRAMVKIMKEMGEDVKELHKIKTRKFKRQQLTQSENDNGMEVEGGDQCGEQEGTDVEGTMTGVENDDDQVDNDEDESDEPDEPDKENFVECLTQVADAVAPASDVLCV